MAEDRLTLGFRHGRAPDPGLLRVLVEGVDIGAVRNGDGGWRPDQQPAAAGRATPEQAAADLLRDTFGLSEPVAQAALFGGLGAGQRDDLLVVLGVARPGG